jgi:hypothetical protein
VRTIWTEAAFLDNLDRPSGVVELTRCELDSGEAALAKRTTHLVVSLALISAMEEVREGADHCFPVRGGHCDSVSRQRSTVVYGTHEVNG